jgi:hypothetical protein
MRGLLAAMQEKKRRQALGERYVEALLKAASADDVQWLAREGAKMEALARIELAYAQRAIGLIVAERDALDDQTAADVSHALDAVVAKEARSQRETAGAWNEHWRDYADALAARGRAEPPLGRIARVLLRRCGVLEPTAEQLARAVRIVTAFRHTANDALRAVYGSASLPEDRAPSAWFREKTGHG